MNDTGHRAEWQRRLYVIIFEADTPAGKRFDVILLVCIVLSVLAVLLESVTEIETDWGQQLRALEWLFTGLFTVEYTLRMLSVRSPLRYARSFFGIVDLLAILPTFLSLVVSGTQSLIVIRALRLLRVFRVLKLASYVGEAQLLRRAIVASSKKITVFLVVVLTTVLIIGSLMYLIEGPSRGYTSIPQSMYWAIVTMTTVGYGDVTPSTVPGKLFASLVMIIGYAIIAVPTGIVTVELGLATRQRQLTTRGCPECASEGHEHDSVHCKHCGAKLAD